MKRSVMLCASAVALVAFALTADRAPAQAVNYNSSKSNSGNRLDPPMGNKMGTGKGQPGMAVKGSGVPKNTTKNISDGAAKGHANE